MAEFNVPDDVLKLAKIRIRRTSASILDDEIKHLIKTAMADLERIGVHESYLKDCSDPLIREAIIVYAKANFGNNPDSEKLMNSYSLILQDIKGACKYRDGNNTQIN